MDKKYTVLFIAVIILSVALNGLQWNNNNSLNANYVLLQRDVSDLKLKNSGLQENIIALTEKNNKVQSDLTSALVQNSNLQKNITTLSSTNEKLQQDIIVLNQRLKGILPYSKANLAPITLLNNFDQVHNPTMDELKAFLRTDSTERTLYQDNMYMCGDFAERLHNNAERAGLRAAVVVIHFTQGPPHACNAFFTYDKKLVYIDDTGSEYSGAEDKVAYIVEGKEYGQVGLSVATSYDYSFYTDYRRRVNEYETKLSSYNAEVRAYNLALGGRTVLREPEYSYFKQWSDKLRYQETILDNMLLTLGPIRYKTLGTVVEIEVFW